MRREVVKVNLGCGPSGINGWLNYDWGVLPLLSKMRSIRRMLIQWGCLDTGYSVDWPPIRLVDIRKSLPLNDKSVDDVYCSHVLEHFERWEAESILKECKRVLRSDGVLRLVVPDLVKMVKSYRGADKFCREFFGFEKDKKTWRRKFIRGHQWMYDEKSIVGLLRAVGFKKVEVVSWRRGKMPDLEDLDLKTHRKLSLYVEAIKD